MCKENIASFIVPPSVVRATKGSCRRLAFRGKVNISQEKVRKFSAAQNPEGFGSSMVLMHGHRGLEGSIQFSDRVTDPTKLRGLMATMVAGLDEIREHELQPKINFGQYSAPGHNQSADQCYFAFKRVAETIEGHAFAVDGTGNIILSCTFTANRALITAEKPTTEAGTSRGVLQQPAYAGASGT